MIDRVPSYMLLRLPLILFILTISLDSISQDVLKVSGRVVSEVDKEPIPFCHINLKGTNYGSVANELGEFIFLIPERANITLEISAIGYTAKSVAYEDTSLVISLKPSITLLKEVEVTSTSESPEEIVKRAFKEVKNNYIKEPLVLETFYRHTCKDNDRYGRIIDAQIDIYKKQGYGRIENYNHSKDQYAVNELRRSFDQSHMRRTTHQPMVLDLMLKSDIAALKQRNTNNDNLVRLVLEGESFVSSKMHSFEFTWEGQMRWDSLLVYKIGYHLAEGPDKNMSFPVSEYSGNFFINSSDYAILKYESLVASNGIKMNQTVDYKNYNGSYALFNSRNEIEYTSNRNEGTHIVNIDLTVNNLVIGKRDDIDQTAISRSYLAAIPYHSDFWSDYNEQIDLSIPDSISADLQSEGALDEQFYQMSALERLNSQSVLQQRTKLDSIIASNQQTLVIFLWASGSKESIYAYYRSSENRQKLSDLNVKLLFVSVDERSTDWSSTIFNHNMEDKTHLRIGPDAAFVENLKLEALPRILIYDQSELVNAKAPMIHTSDFMNKVNNLLEKNER